MMALFSMSVAAFLLFVVFSSSFMSPPGIVTIIRGGGGGRLVQPLSTALFRFLLLSFIYRSIGLSASAPFSLLLVVA